MPGLRSRCLMCAIALMLACWHGYGHTSSNPNRGSDERRGDRVALKTKAISATEWAISDPLLRG